MDNSCYKSMYESMVASYDLLYKSFKAAKEESGKLVEENNALEERIRELQANVKGIDTIAEGLRGQVHNLQDKIDKQAREIESYRHVLRDVIHSD